MFEGVACPTGRKFVPNSSLAKCPDNDERYKTITFCRIFLSVCHLRIYQLAMIEPRNYNRLRGRKINKLNYIYMYIYMEVSSATI